MHGWLGEDIDDLTHLRCIGQKQIERLQDLKRGNLFAGRSEESRNDVVLAESTRYSQKYMKNYYECFWLCM